MIKKLIVPLTEVAVPEKISIKKLVEKRNDIIDDLVECKKKEGELFIKYRDFLGQYQEIRRQHNEIENKLIEFHQRIKYKEERK